MVVYTKEELRLLRILNGVIRWKKGKKQAQLQKKRLLRKIKYWERTKNKSISRPDPKIRVVPHRGYDPSAAALSLHPMPEHDEGDQIEGIDLFRFPIIDWNYRWQRPQQISRQFARNGTRVFYFYIDTLPVNNADATFEQIQSAMVVEEAEPNVWLVRLCSHSKLNAYRDPIENALDQKFMLWSIEALKQKFDIRHTVSIVDLPFWSPVVFALDHNKIIYDCMDDHAGFSNTSEALLSLEPNLIKMADLVVTSSMDLYNNAKTFNPSVYLIPNAAEYEHFAVDRYETPSDISQISGPIVGYIGAIADWFDMELVYEVASRNPDWNFVLIGDTYFSDITQIEALPNVYLLGERSYGDLPKYLGHFDVCMIPFVMNRLTQATNPVKVYEYLATGKPVVSTELPELHTMRQYVCLADGAEAFEQAIRQALEEKDDLSLIEKRRQFAASNTWTDRFNDFRSLVLSRLYPKVSTIVVTHNNWQLTRKCIDSLQRNTDYPRFELLVVDNASSDGTRERLRKESSPDLKVILLPENVGFAEANIIGVTNTKGEYIVFLNNDTIVPHGWLSRLLRPFWLDPDIGAVGPMSNHVGNDQKLDFFVGDDKNGPNEVWLQEFFDLYDRRMRYSEMLGFFCVAVKREVYAKVGHLDKEFGIGMFEDDDYCLRMLKAGYRIAVAEDAFVYHHGSAAFNQWNVKQYKELFAKNKEYFETKWGITWKQPNMPMSLFINVNNSDKVAELMAQSGKRPIWMNAPENWGLPHKKWQKDLLAMCSDETIVVVHVSSYLQKPVQGVRKLGPGLYITSDEEIFKKTKFDQVYSLKEKET